MGSVFSIESIYYDFRIIGPLNCEHDVSVVENWLISDVIKSITKCCIILSCSCYFSEIIIVIFVGFKGRYLIFFIDYNIDVSIVLI
jgi:hypothetical protein